MTNTDPYISDYLDYVYLDINQTTLEPTLDEYGGSSGHIITSTEYLSVLSSPTLTYGRKYFVYCVFFVTGAEEARYDYRIVDGLGTPFPDGVFNIKNTQAQGTGYDDTSKNGTYGSWFKVFYANSDSSIYFETKAIGEDNYSSVYYAQFLTIDITDLKEDYHYFYKQDSIESSNPTTKYTVQPDEDSGVSSDWMFMSNYSILDLQSTVGTIKLFKDNSFVQTHESNAVDSSDENWDKTNRPKTIFNTMTISDATEISLKFDPSSGKMFYPKLFGLRMDLFDDNTFHNDSNSSFSLSACESSTDPLSIKTETITAKNSEYFILGQIVQDGIFSSHEYVDDWEQEQKITSPNAGTENYFGSSVSIWGSYAIVAERDYTNGFGTTGGAAYIYELQGGTWTEVKFLQPPILSDKDLYGHDVYIDGNHAIIGWSHEEIGLHEGVGAAEIYERDSGGSWTLSDKITASDAYAADAFGYSVSISGIYAVIGAPFNDDSGGTSGSAYVFKLEDGTWTEKQKIIASDANGGDLFGEDVDIYNDKIVVSALGDDDNGSASGSAYVFERSDETWTETQKIIASDGEPGDRFGISVSVDGNIIAIGADRNAARATDSGAVYIFEKQCEEKKWNQTNKIFPSDGSLDDRFGCSVSLDSRTLAIGATGVSSDAGAAYVYERKNTNTWIFIEKLVSSDAAAEDGFGVSIDVFANNIIIGAWLDDDAVRDSGSVYIFNSATDESSLPIIINEHNNAGISCNITVDGVTNLSYPLDQYSIVYDVDTTNASFPELNQLENQIIPISLHIPSVNDSFAVQFSLHNNNITDDILFNNLKYSILGNKVRKYAPKSISLQGKTLKDISPDMMICSYTNSGIDSESSILGGFDTQDPRNYVIDGLGNKLPFRWSSTMKDYFFDRGKIDNPLNNQELHYILSLGNAPERPYPFRTDIFDIDEYNCLAATLYDDVVISLRSKYFEDDIERINESIEFYMILNKQDWYDSDNPIKIGEYISYESGSVSDLKPCGGSDNCLLKLNFNDWNLSSSEKKIFHFFTNNSSNEHIGNDEAKKGHRYWFVNEIKPSSNLDRISRHFNYEDVFIEDTVPDFYEGSIGPDQTKFVVKSATSSDLSLSLQTHGRARSFQATDIFNDKDELNLSSFISKSEASLRYELEYQLLGAGADSTDPYFYATLDSSVAHIYFYMPPDWASLHMAYKIIDEDLFNAEKSTTSQWSSVTWSNSLFQDYIGAVSKRLKVLREALVDGKYSSTLSYNTGSRVGLYAFRTNFYGDRSDIEVINTTDYLVQYAYELATSDYDLLKYADYLQVELFPRWGNLDSYTDDDLDDYIDMHLEYAQKVIHKESESVCKLFPLITHKVRNSSSNSYLMILTKPELIKFVNRIEYHIDKINYNFWEYGMYNESSYTNTYTTPSSTIIGSENVGYTGGYIDSYPWTSDPLDPNGLQISESLQPYLHGGLKENTTLWCYFTSLFVDDAEAYC